MAMKMGQAELGKYSLYQSIIAFLSIVVLFSMDGALARYYHRYGSNSVVALRNTAFVIAVVISALFVGGGIFLLDSYFVVSILASFCFALYMLNLSIAQASRQVISYFKAQVLSGVMLLVSILILFEYYESNTLSRVFSSAISWLIPAAWLFFSLKICRPKNKKKLLKKHVAYLLSFGAPLILHNFAGLAKGHVERFIIDANYNKSDLAEYFLAIQMASIFYLLLLALNRAVVPHFYKKLKNKDIGATEVKKIFLQSLSLIPVLPAIVYLIPDIIFTYIFGSDYSRLGDWLSILILGYSLMIPYFILVNFLFYHSKNKVISIVSTVSAISHVLLAYYFAAYSLNLLVYSLFASSLIQVSIMYFYIFKFIDEQ